MVCKGSGYIIEAVLTHERGHVFGLTHGKKLVVSGHGNLTMSPKINAYCSHAEASLGKATCSGCASTTDAARTTGGVAATRPFCALTRG